VCPCCGFDATQSALPASDQAAAPQQDDVPAAPVIKKVAARAGVRMCAICMASVPEQDLVDHEGQMICQLCAENVRKKAMRKAGQPVPMDEPPVPRPVSGPGPGPGPRLATGPVRPTPLNNRPPPSSAGYMIAKVILIILGCLYVGSGALWLLSGTSLVHGFFAGLNIFLGASLITGFGIWITRVFIILALLGAVLLGGLGVLAGGAGAVLGAVMLVAAAIYGVVLWLTYIVHPS